MSVSFVFINSTKIGRGIDNGPSRKLLFENRSALKVLPTYKEAYGYENQLLLAVDLPS